MAGHALKWKEIRSGGKGYWFYVWHGGIPTPEEISYKAPPFTLFPSPVKVKDATGKLPHGEETDGGGEMVWFASSRDEVSYDEDVLEVLRAAGLCGKDEVPDSIISTNDDLRDEILIFHGKKIAGGPDSDAWPWAIEAGYSLVKVPDEVGSAYFELYIIDELREVGDRYDWYQSPKREEWLKQAPVPGSMASDLDMINEHRRLLGMPPLDPSARGWKPEDIAAEARRIRALNPWLETKLRMLAM